jgi:RecA/RadA recombinase
LKLLELFIERNAITSIDEANELIESTGQGFLTTNELALLPTIVKHTTIFQVPNEVEDFTGREQIIEIITQQITQGKVIHIYGPPGVGKTTAAIKIAHVVRDDFPDGVLWYRMDTTSSKDIFISISHLLGKDLPPSKNIEVQASFIRSLLSQKKLLLILDNVAMKNDMHLLLPIVSSSVIILSRYKNLYIPANSLDIALKSFTKKEVVTLYENVLKKEYVKKYHHELIQISQLVGDLPLAVHLFAKQLQQSKTSPSELLHAMQKEEISLGNLPYENKNLFVAIEICYQNLSKKVQSVFLSLGVFEGRDFAIETIAHINGLSVEQTNQILEDLLNTSLIESSIHNKFRIHPMVKKFISEKLNNPHLFMLIKITGVLFCIFTISWIIVQILSNKYWEIIFSASYFNIALLGGILGIYIAQKWGGIKSIMGKALLFFSFGLFTQAFGEIVYSFFTIFYHIEVPYPSLGDIGYFGTIPLYICGTFFLMQASGGKIELSNIKKNKKILAISIIILIIADVLLLQQYKFNWSNPVKIFLDFGYPLGDIIYVYFAFLTYIQLKNTKETIMKNKILMIFIALCFQWLSDYTFVYQANNKTWHPGQINDYMYFISYLLMTLGILQLNSYRFKIIGKIDKTITGYSFNQNFKQFFSKK